MEFITHVCLFSDEGVIERREADPKNAFELDLPALKRRLPDFKFFTLYSNETVLFSATVAE